MYLDNANNKQQATYPSLQTRNSYVTCSLLGNFQGHFEPSDSRRTGTFHARLVFGIRRELGYELCFYRADFVRHLKLDKAEQTRVMFYGLSRCEISQIVDWCKAGTGAYNPHPIWILIRIDAYGLF